MKTLLIASLAMMAIGVPAQAQTSHPGWVVGEWGDAAATGSDDRQAECGDHSIVYDAAGRYTLMDDAGTWTVQGDRLCTRKLIEYDETRKTWRSAPGRPDCQPVRRNGERIETRQANQWAPMGRCGTGEIDAQTAKRVDAAARRGPATRRRR